MNGILIVAHAPLAQALRQCALHVFPDCGPVVAALDVQPQASAEDSLAQARSALAALDRPQVLVLTDLFGATPCNVAQRLVAETGACLVTGVNLPMLLRAITYRSEPLPALAARAVVGGAQGVMQLEAGGPRSVAESDKKKP